MGTEEYERMLKFIFLSYRVNSQIWLNLIVYDWIRLSIFNERNSGLLPKFFVLPPFGGVEGGK